jgi:hypothetical protein
MTPMELEEASSIGGATSFGTFGAGFTPSLPVAERDDSALCFLCMRWAAGDAGCRTGARCEHQLALDRTEASL